VIPLFCGLSTIVILHSILACKFDMESFLGFTNSDLATCALGAIQVGNSFGCHSGML
jgi:hypothetical protein